MRAFDRFKKWCARVSGASRGAPPPSDLAREADDDNVVTLPRESKPAAPRAGDNNLSRPPSGTRPAVWPR
jgi:hypothetical protein